MYMMHVFMYVYHRAYIYVIIYIWYQCFAKIIQDFWIKGNLLHQIWLMNINVITKMTRPPDKSTLSKILFLFLNQNIWCEYSKEPSQCNGSFEHLKQMFKLIDKKLLTILSYLDLWWRMPDGEGARKVAKILPKICQSRITFAKHNHIMSCSGGSQTC